MPDPVRHTILAQLKASMEAIATGAGYWQTVAKCEIVARAYDDPEVIPAVLPYVAIMPGDEQQFPEMNDQLRCEWSIDLLMHFALADRTDLGLSTACGKASADLRHAVGSIPHLGMDDVISVDPTRRKGSEGTAECIATGVASVCQTVVVRFFESYTGAG